MASCPRRWMFVCSTPVTEWGLVFKAPTLLPHFCMPRPLLTGWSHQPSAAAGHRAGHAAVLDGGNVWGRRRRKCGHPCPASLPAASAHGGGGGGWVGDGGRWGEVGSVACTCGCQCSWYSRCSRSDRRSRYRKYSHRCRWPDWEWLGGCRWCCMLAPRRRNSAATGGPAAATAETAETTAGKPQPATATAAAATRTCHRTSSQSARATHSSHTPHTRPIPPAQLSPVYPGVGRTAGPRTAYPVRRRGQLR